MHFREDIEGLRGVAALVVVLFHAGVAGMSGGYIGVDVFFVISGYLISSQLIGQLEQRGRIEFAQFWARRFRRLMPLLAVTVVGTLVAGLWVYSPLFWGQLSREAVSSMLYVSNVQFARDSSFYFQSETSPLLHTWSLSVEEQFYAAWPLVFGLVALIAQRLRRRLLASLAAVVLAVSAASFVLGLLMTRRGTPWAFFSSPTRAWEFGAGAMTLLVSRSLSPSRTPALVGWLGLGGVVLAAVTFDRFTEMPGVAALLPVVGTALVLLAGPSNSRAGVAGLLAQRPLRSLGRVSYAWYLFHWPAIVLTAAAMKNSDFRHAAIASVASLVLAYLATWAIERPIRNSRLLARPSLAIGAAVLTAALIVPFALVIDRQAQQKLRDPYLAALLATREGRSETGSSNCELQALADGTKVCSYGSPLSDTTVVLLGDSHAAQWAPAMEVVAQQLSLRLIVRSLGGCPAYPVFVARTGDDEPSQVCLNFREATSGLLLEFSPALVVVANADFTSRMLASPQGEFLDRSEALVAWGDGAAVFARDMKAIGTGVAMIENNPDQDRDPIECLARHRSVGTCSVSAAVAVPPVEEISAAEQTALSSVVPTEVFRSVPLICDAEHCLVERRGVVVYADRNHLSQRFVLQQSDALEAFVASALIAHRS